MVAGAASEYTHIYIMQLRIQLHTAQVRGLVIGYLVHLDEVNLEIIRVMTPFNIIPVTLFPLLTTLTVTALSGESFPVLLSKFFNLFIMVSSSFTYLVDQSSSRKDFG
jgi:hypothetical protein